MNARGHHSTKHGAAAHEQPTSCASQHMLGANAYPIGTTSPIKFILAIVLLVLSFAVTRFSMAAQPERHVGDQSPAKNYQQHCAGCHQLDGSGSRSNDVPDMRNSVGHFVRTEVGRAFLIQVAGVAQAPLAAEDLSLLMNWLLSRFSAAQLPADFSPYSTAEVEMLLQNRPADLPAMRGRLLEQLREMGHDVMAYN